MWYNISTERKVYMPLPKLVPLEQQQEPLKVLIYGASGTGKTTIASTIAGDSVYDTLLVNVDKGTESVPPNKKIMSVDISLTNYTDWSELALELSKPPNARSGEYKNIRHVVVDSLSSARDTIMAGSTEGKSTTTYTDWGKMSKMIFDFIDRVKIHNNIILIAQEKVQQVGDRQRITIDLNPHVANGTVYRVDYIWYTSTKLIGGVPTYTVKMFPTDDVVLVKSRIGNKQIRQDLQSDIVGTNLAYAKNVLKLTNTEPFNTWDKIVVNDNESFLVDFVTKMGK